MRRIFVSILFLCLFATPSLAYERVQGWCENGGFQVTISGNPQGSSGRFQRSFPSCTVTVYLTGTVTLATIYSDDSATAKANPFTATSAGQWFFYADNGRYDVRFSGGGIPAPFTLGDFTLFDPTLNDAVCYADAQAGSDAAAKINACITALPSTGGVVIGDGLDGTQSGSTTITLNKPVVVRMGYGTFTSSANPAFNLTANGSSIACASPNSAPDLFVADTGCIIATTHTTGDIIKIDARSTSVTDVTLRYASGSARTGGSAMKFESGSTYGNYERINIEKTYIGINMAEGGSTGTFRDIHIHSFNAGAGGVWYEAIVLSGCTAANIPAQYGCGAGIPATVTDTHFDNVIISQDAVYSGAAVVNINGGTDSITFNRLLVIKSAPCDTTDCGILMLLQNTVGAVGGSFDPPRWISCTICAFEGAASNATNPVIWIKAGKSVRFLDTLEIAGGTQGILIKNGTNIHEYIDVVEIASTPIALSGQENIRVELVGGGSASPNGFVISDIYIHHNSLSLAGQQANNTYSSLYVGNGIAKFYITDNDFDPLFGGFTNEPSYYIQLGGTNMDDFVVKDNHFTAAFRVTADILNPATGYNVITGPNTTDTAGNARNMRVNGAFMSTSGYGPTTAPDFLAGQFGCGSAVMSTSCSLAWGDGTTGYQTHFGSVVGGAFAPRFTFLDYGTLLPAASTSTYSIGNSTLQFRIFTQRIATGSLPAAGAFNNMIIIEDAGAGDQNLIIYANNQRFRIDGGAPF